MLRAAVTDPVSHSGAEPAKASKQNRRGSSSSHVDAALGEVGRTNGRAGGLRPRTPSKGGVTLRLNDKHDDLDGEFERY